MTGAPSIFSAGELQEVPRVVEAAQGQDVRAGAGAGRDPHEGCVVSPSRTHSEHTLQTNSTLYKKVFNSTWSVSFSKFSDKLPPVSDKSSQSSTILGAEI